MRNPRNESLDANSTGKRGGRGDTPERRCIVSGRIDTRDNLLRLAVSPDGDVLPDALARAPGRGAWIGVSREELEQAQASGKLKAALARAFKTGKLQIPEDLPALMENALMRAFLQRLGLEMRAGHLILGSDRIAGEARMGCIAALYHAADASDDGCRKLDQAFRVGMDAEGSGMAGIRLPLDRTALSVALGRENVVHLALADGASAGRVAIPLGRLLNFTKAADAAEGDAGRAVMESGSEGAVSDRSLATKEF
ncbi:hypothetical protein FHS61_001618 [Altererythrobacter atlanticus]|uniref:YlxR domain-containing protein n=1 Tax=Croceibacterium atlanticum TaxID=1267766 RepID=A0A0F7KNF1_9SPHN|nr:DUF448 domain-containing protein [Croceibacterium atlanticum]AKH41094.1 hypothetical protein WYH_00027 [Croceibacterium atlanticum]MBB5732609.1 hypothetical protein [Croceibacterium atlanticum]